MEWWEWALLPINYGGTRVALRDPSFQGKETWSTGSSGKGTFADHSLLHGDHLTQRARCGHNDYMARNTVGARELKTRLGTYLQRVREGRTLVVTDRGQPVAELRPLPTDDSLPSTLLKLATTGAVTLPTVDALSTFRPVRNRGASVSDAVRMDREDRL